MEELILPSLPFITSTRSRLHPRSLHPFEIQIRRGREIQKVFRGFMVRKIFRKIVDIKREVDEIDRRISLRETVQLIGRDPKERIKVNENLMSLLFRLDTVPGNDSGVRNCRKTLIKRTIRLQERLDAMIVSGETILCETLDTTVVSADSYSSSSSAEEEEEEDREKKSRDDNDNDNKKGGGKDLKERMMIEEQEEGNKRLMCLMKELLERNESQTRLISYLLQRVELLERSFMMSERLKKRVKNRQASAEWRDTASDPRKCVSEEITLI